MAVADGSIFDADGCRIASTNGSGTENRANARLIAAAPEMAEALQRIDATLAVLLNDSDRHYPDELAFTTALEERDSIRTLLARIEGERP